MLILSKILLGALCGVFVATGAFGVTGAESATVAKLLAEKQQKMAKLEQCAKKVKGFKIAGISTLGLTAVGVGGNVMLASKQKDISHQITSTKAQIEKKQEELEKINEKIDVANEQKRIEDEKREAEEQRLNNCPGNLYRSIQSLCPNCVTKDDRESMCEFNTSGDEWAKKSGDKIVFSAEKISGGEGVFTKTCSCSGAKDEAVETQKIDEKQNEDAAKKDDNKKDDAKKDDDKKDEGEEKVSGVIKAECKDSAKHIAEGVYKEKADGDLSCYKSEKDTTVVKCMCEAKECDSEAYEVIGGVCKEKHILGKVGEMCQPANPKAALIYRLGEVKADNEYDVLRNGAFVKAGKNWCNNGEVLCECFATLECIPGYTYDTEKRGCKETVSGLSADMKRNMNNVNNGGTVLTVDYSKPSFGNSSTTFQRNFGTSNSFSLR